MGYYLDSPLMEAKGKTAFIENHWEAIQIDIPTRDELYQYKDEGKAVICVFENLQWDGAAFIHDNRELLEFTQEDDPRQMVWLLMDWKDAARISDYKG